jgi:hypothetical protein
MKRTVWIWQFFGFAVAALVGTLLHFLYELTGGALWIAPFSGVNESTWEHMKLLFWPMFIFALVESLFFREREDFWCVKLRGILLGLILIPVVFYTYSGAFGKSADWINIAIFFISAAIAYIYETRLFKSENTKCKFPTLALSALVALAFFFILFTFKTPEIDIFKDPLTNSYGI